MVYFYFILLVLNFSFNQLLVSAQQCTRKQNTGIWGNNLAYYQYEKDDRNCCQRCKERQGCKGYMWTSDSTGGTCWLQSATGFQFTSPGAITGIITEQSSNTGTCLTQLNKDVRGKVLTWFTGKRESACCGLCQGYTGCKAYVYQWNYQGGTCWLKDATWPLVDNKGVNTGLMTGRPLPGPITRPTPPPQVVTQRPPAPNGGQGSMDQKVKDALLQAHDECRQNVGLGPVSWDVNLENFATKWNQNLAAMCSQMQHSSETQRRQIRGYTYVGENLAMGVIWGPQNPVQDAVSYAKTSVQMWCDEKKYYNYARNTCQSGMQCGHYTQVVWKDSTKIGCGLAKCQGKWFLGCNYGPGGNYPGKQPY